MSANRMICANGHYYDGSRYTECPHCAEGLPRVEPSVFVITNNSNKESDRGEQKKTERRGFFSRRKKEPQEKPLPEMQRISKESTATEEVQRNTDDHDMTRGLQTMSQDVEAVRGSFPVKVQGGITRGGETASGQAATPGQTEQPIMQGVMSNSVAQPVYVGQSAQTMPVQPAQQSQNLSVAFAQATAPQKQTIDKDKTVSFFSTGGKSEPPVGYLICIAGEDFGCGFSLKSGNNAIGRGQAMDVVIRDPKVSREKQAFVMYEPKSRKFFVRPGEGSGLCYLNGELVMSAVEIHQFDKLGLGDTELMLIVVCCEQFSWEDYEVTAE